MLTEALTFVSVDWIKPLAKKLKTVQDDRIKEINRISDTFGDPEPLARYYVEPKCQRYNPADRHEDEELISFVKTPVFTTINDFLGGEATPQDGRTQMFILADTGMGKTSLLVMLKLTQLLGFWPSDYDCLLLKLGPDSLDAVRKHANKANTVLLLDALDEDPTAWGRIEQRLIELLQETTHFRRVLISCRARSFPETGTDPFGNSGQATVGGFICSTIFLSLFDEPRVREYLYKRFPDPWHSGLTGKKHKLWLRAEQFLNSMHSPCSRPLLLAHIKDLLDADRPQWGDEYAIYDALTETWLLREASALAKQGIDPLPTKEDLWTSCTAVAVYLQALGKGVLSQAELRDLVASLPTIALIERFDFGDHSLMNRASNREYRFSHYSIQEFLVVQAIVEGRLEAARGIGPATVREAKLRATAQMLDFVRCRLAGIDVLELMKSLDWSGIKSNQLAGWLHFHEQPRDGGAGPEMVVIPAGEFLMGSPEDESGRQATEEPQHPVAFGQPFAMGRHPVTFDEYDRFCESTGRQKPNDRGWGRGRRPVINVHWEDAVAYCTWLSRETGAPYRLPSEAEWEYAARAGTKTAFWWGDEIDTERANHDGNSTYRNGTPGEYRKKTVPVDDFQPNAFGLHQVHGNVWEWVQDSWHDDYRGAPADGSAWEESAGGPRVLRGGSWNDAPERLRSAARIRFNPRFRNDNAGFRLARTL